MAPAASRSAILRLINAAQHSSCPCHSCSPAAIHGHGNILSQMRKYATPVNTLQKEYAFEVSFFMIYHLKALILSVFIEVAASNLRFGDGVTAEVGMDLKNMKASKVRSSEITYINSTNYSAGWRVYGSQCC
jgi:hydroxyacid-oxoacid transhydrogenase